MFPVQQELLSHLPLKRKATSTGWISFNAPCCHHRGHNADTRSRGGLLPNSDGNTSFHCFNCGFTANWKPGRRLNLKMRKLMEWLGIAEDNIRRLSLFALSQLDISTEVKKEEQKELPTFEPKELCPGKPLLSWIDDPTLSTVDREQLKLIIEYVNSRGLIDRLDQFYWHNDTASPVYNRVLIPFTWLGQNVGYSGRSIVATKRKYYTEHPSNFVFNYDNQLTNAKFCLVVEGILDAVAMDAVSVLSNECNETQALVIDSLNREVIVVPDRDKAGLKLINAALDYGWNVAFPDWEEGVKDCADAVKKYGQLFTMRTILDSVETSSLKIKLLSKKWIGA